jgi:hypothetical protein
LAPITIHATAQAIRNALRDFVGANNAILNVFQLMPKGAMLTRANAIMHMNVTLAFVMKIAVSHLVLQSKK